MLDKNLKNLFFFIFFLLISCGDNKKTELPQITPQDQATKLPQITLQGSNAQEEGYDSGGVDFAFFFKKDKLAWFEAKQAQINICIKSPENFYFSTFELKELIKDSFARWGRYILRKDTSLADILGNPWDKINFPESCEQTKDNIIFYFGGEDNKDIKKIQKRFNQPLGLSFQTKKNGIIWIANSFEFKNKKNAISKEWFQMILLHEIGHAFGNHHIHGTIMDETITSKLFFSKWIKSKGFDLEIPSFDNLISIDQSKELILEENYPLNFTGIFSIDEKTSKTILKEISPEIRGDKEISLAELEITKRGYIFPKGFQAVLKLNTKEGKTEFHIELDNKNYSENILEEAFFSYYRDYDVSYFLQHKSFIQTGILTTESGNTFNVILERNTDYTQNITSLSDLDLNDFSIDKFNSYPLKVFILLKGRKVPLFAGRL